MANIYDAMVFALREHWKAYEGAPPQRFELTDDSLQALNEAREMVISAMSFTLKPGWEREFHGAPVVLTKFENCLVDKKGNRIPLGFASSAFSSSGDQDRRNDSEG